MALPGLRSYPYPKVASKALWLFGFAGAPACSSAATAVGSQSSHKPHRRQRWCSYRRQRSLMHDNNQRRCSVRAFEVMRTEHRLCTDARTTDFAPRHVMSCHIPHAITADQTSVLARIRDTPHATRPTTSCESRHHDNKQTPRRTLQRLIAERLRPLPGNAPASHPTPLRSARRSPDSVPLRRLSETIIGDRAEQRHLGGDSETADLLPQQQLKRPRYADRISPSLSRHSPSVSRQPSSASR